MRSIASSFIVGILFVVGSALIVPKAAFALGGHDGTPEQDYVDYAVINDALQSTWYMFSLDSANTPQAFSSAVGLSAGGGHWVITSGHGVLDNESDPNSFFDSYLIGTGSNTATDFGEFQLATEVFLHPLYSGPESGVDLALLYFEDPFLTGEMATIYTGDVQVDDILSMAGFGLYGTPSGGIVPASTGQRRGGETLIDFVDFPDNDYVESLYDSPASSEYLPLGVQTLPGDSGGGWYIDVNGQLQLAGITSGGSPVPGYGSASSAYLVANQLDWINETIASKQVPEPASATLLLIGGVAAGLRRRRRSTV